MGNALGGRRKGAKVMQLDGTAFRVKPPAFAGTVLNEHPGFQLLESEQVKLLGVRARPLEPDAPLRPGRLYFLVALPRPTAPPRRAWSGALHVGARERLESLMLTRRSTSDLTFPTTAPASPLSTASEGGPVQLRMRLPKAQVAKLMGESRDAAEAAAKIMQLCAANGALATPERRTPERSPRFVPTPDWGTAAGSGELAQTPEMSPRFVPTPDWGTGAGRFARTPERSPRFAVTPEWGSRFMMPTPESGGAKTPDRWTALSRTPEYYASPDAKASRKEKRTRFVALPDEVIA
ncbi:uncharacterized protein At1g66480 [Brachypodium distachyon]|uniref:DUF4228 domain-containing protein n=1 Tax=Brachypodium distachyon TaxID=15368 RepID=I1GZ72_BRADI|nr:uncharacterized protein At1g66480 [Brachypodium distachyon]KQK18682.1 hypothetical protein BRADI_1g44040v3 [Brachypodium distachyon]|eukprot:XP_003563985.1 uncharacterized protein At1g66480 [Brachypodium distachyon]